MVCDEDAFRESEAVNVSLRYNECATEGRGRGRRRRRLCSMLTRTSERTNDRRKRCWLQRIDDRTDGRIERAGRRL